MMKFSLTQLGGRLLCGGALLLAVLAVPVTSHAQTVTLFGALANFDVLNDTGHDANGFEIELDGITAQQVLFEFNWTRYGSSQIIPIQGGVIVRWQSPWDPVSQRFTIATTTPAVFAPTLGHSCVGTAIVGCDHYGVSLAYYSVPPTSTKYYWLVPDPNNLGGLMRFGGAPIQIPQPVVTVIPPAQIGNPPQVAFQIQADPPPAPEIPKPVPQYGEAKWVKVYKTEVDREVGLDELVNDNPVVPQDPGKVETGWKLLQFNPHTNGNSGVLRNQGPVGFGSRAVLRRYEFYKFSGAYDPLDHSAQCADGTCSAPSDGEVGDFIGDQNAAVNVGVPSVIVTKNGNGSITGASGKINCGGSCSTTTNLGDVVTLTETSASNAVFTGWGGACAGTQPTCTIAVNDQMNVTANFTTIFNLSIGRGGSGTVTATPAGVDRAINCGSTCSAKFPQGTTITLTAIPAPGLSFVSWTNGCVSSTPTCTLIIGKDTSAQANFK
jgi:uncharacterized repeat protein (TIGR02543 family)